MKVEIPESLVYFGTGVMVDRVVQNILGTTIKDVIKNVLHILSEKQRLKEIEARRVVDVMGDTLGFFDNKGNIIKGELDEY